MVNRGAMAASIVAILLVALAGHASAAAQPRREGPPQTQQRQAPPESAAPVAPPVAWIDVHMHLIGGGGSGGRGGPTGADDFSGAKRQISDD